MIDKIRVSQGFSRGKSDSDSFLQWRKISYVVMCVESFFFLLCMPFIVLSLLLIAYVSLSVKLQTNLHSIIPKTSSIVLHPKEMLIK